MANTIDSKTDGEILASIVDGTIEELEDDMITTLQDFSLAYLYDDDGVRHLKKLYLPNVTTVGRNVLRGSIGYSSSNPNAYKINNLDGSIFPKLQNSRNDTENSKSYCFSNLSVKRINLPEWTGGTDTSSTISSRFRESTPETIVLGKPTILSSYELMGTISDTTLKAVCLGENTEYTGTKYIQIAAIDRRYGFHTLVLYGEKLWTLNNINAIGNSNYFKSNGTGGTIYVPQSMIDTYTSATNWSTIIGYTNNQILPIEGSPYEHYYCDGTPIGLGNTGGMIAYYDVGNVNDWDTETKYLESHVPNDYIAYGRAVMAARPSDSVIPAIYYSKYASQHGGIQIHFGTSLINISDTITFEYLIANNSSVFFAGIHASTKDLNGSTADTWGITSINRSLVGCDTRTFSHVVAEFNNNGLCNLYINGVHKTYTQTINNCLNVKVIGIGSEDAYLGCVAVYNRSLPQEVVTEHYQYYSENVHAGELAFDSSGNFIAT